jgi:iron complex outermembrane receptor protein
MKRIASGRVAADFRRAFALRATVAALAGAGLMSTASIGAQELAAVAVAPAVPEAAAAATAADPQSSMPASFGQPADANAAVVRVTGTRAAARTAQAIKQKAEQVLDSIVADDIGKFPDKNVAEILGRVPGVQVVRENGEAGNIVIRGLGGVVTLINGREMFTAANRSLVLSDVPVAMLQRVDVYKSQGADMVEGGTSGVIDVRTNRPFDFKGSQAAVTARAEHRDKAGKVDPNVSALLSNRWKSGIGEFGLLGGLSYQRGRYHDETAFVGQPLEFISPASGETVMGAPSMGRVMGGGDRKRVAANLAAQWRPSKDVEVYAEGFSTRIDHDSQSIFFVGDLPINDPASTITTRPGTNYLQSISNPNANTFTLSSTQARRDDSKGSQGAVGILWDVSPTVRVTSEFVRTVSAYSQQNPILDTVRDAAKPISAGVRDGGGYLDYPGVNMLDPSAWRLFAMFDNHNRANGGAKDWRGDINWSPENGGVVKEISGGVRIAQRTASYVHELGNYAAAPGGILASSFPGLACASPETGGDYGMNQFFAPCMNYLLDNTGAIRQAIRGDASARPDDPLSYFADREKTNAVYGKLKFGFDLGRFPVDGVAGVRVVRTAQTISGFSSANGVVSPITVGSTTTDVLPSLSTRLHLRDDLVARLVAGKAIERAPFGDYNPGLVLFPSTTTTLATGTAGNPNLKPQEGRNVDLALEWYFSKDGSLTGTLFDHRFKNYLRRTSLPEVHDGATYQVSRPYNAVDGHLKGFEASYQQFYTRLPGWLGGLGMQANVTYMDGGMSEPDGSTNTFPGMSKVSYNLVGLYERGPWSARLAYSWRDKAVAEYNYRATGYNLYIDPRSTLDASLSYKISDSLTVTLDGNNLLDQAYHDYHGVPELPRDIRRYDRVVGLALRWRN